LFCKVPISMATASLGGEIEVPTIDGKKARVTIPEGAQSGKQFRLKAKGMPVLRSTQSGDMYIQVAVETPVNLTRKQRDLLREFDKEARNNSPESEGFFAKAKAFWDGFA
jgi:molecular chaperone DnaJ